MLSENIARPRDAVDIEAKSLIAFSGSLSKFIDHFDSELAVVRSYLKPSWELTVSEDYKSAVDEDPLKTVPERSQVPLRKIDDQFEMMIPAALTYIVVQEKSNVLLHISFEWCAKRCNIFQSGFTSF